MPKAVFRFVVIVLAFAITGLVLASFISPWEFVRFSRDKQRAEELQQLSDLIARIELEKPEAILAQENTVYISLPDTNSNCQKWHSKGLPAPPEGFSYHCVPRQRLRNIDGSGWLPIRFTALAQVPFDQLPIDPANGQKGIDPDSGKKILFYYQFIKGSFSLGAFRESPPNPDDSYAAEKKKTIVKTVIGVTPTDVGTALGGKLIIAGSSDLARKVNKEIAAVASQKVETEAKATALNEIEKVLEKAPVAGDAAQLASLVLEETKTKIKPSLLVNQALKKLSRKQAVSYIQEVKTRVQRQRQLVNEELNQLKSQIKEKKEKTRQLPTKTTTPSPTLPLQPPVSQAEKEVSLPEPAQQPASSPETTEQTANKEPTVQSNNSSPSPAVLSPAPTPSSTVDKLPAETAEKLPALKNTRPASVVCYNANQIQPNNQDSDGDGLTDIEEIGNPPGTLPNYGTDPYDPDSDGDCLTDSQEVNIYKTNPNTKDSDADYFVDSWEIANGYDPNDPASPDADGDGKGDALELLIYKTDPYVAD